MEFVPEDLREKIHPVGRLDRDTTGLLLFTDDGRVDRALLLPENRVPRVYSFTAIGVMNDEKIAAISRGVRLGDSGETSRGASVRVTKHHTVYEIRDLLPPRRRMRYLKNPNGSAFSAEMELTEGRKHEVKLIMRAVDCRVVRLERISFGGLRLDPGLPIGGFRELTEEEYKLLLNLLEDVSDAQLLEIATERMACFDESDAVPEADVLDELGVSPNDIADSGDVEIE